MPSERAERFISTRNVKLYETCYFEVIQLYRRADNNQH
jgi:hypothetical protein